MRRALVVCLLVGCSYAPSRVGPSGGDDDVDAPPADAAPRLLPSNLDTLADLDGVTAALTVDADLQLATGADAGRITGGAGVVRAAGEGLLAGMAFRILDDATAVLAVDGLSIATGRTLRVAGTRALIILARTDITIAGTLDITAKASVPGPGGGRGGAFGMLAIGCGAGGEGEGAPGLNNEAGGGGGGYGGAGAAGGAATNALPGVRGDACGNETLVPLRGGSGGGHGGGTDNTGTGGTGGGDGGGGGGAIQLSALGEVRVDATGVIDAGGGGGGATLDDDGGGGGGGSGGAIFLEAPNVIVAAGGIVVANGGGGGCGNNPAGNGNGSGRPGTRTRMGAAGGTNIFADDLGEGGAGGAIDTMPTAGIGINDGGGGGGGGVGRIRINRTTQTIDPQLISPAHVAGDARYE